MIRPLFVSLIALGVIIPSASAACDISKTKCAVNGGKCNIHFKNRLVCGTAKCFALLQ